MFHCLLLSILLILSSCIVNDQTFAPQSSLYKMANKKFATLTEAKQANSKHKVLVAIIDSGVDYTHPDLKKHMHYNLKELSQQFNQNDEDQNNFIDDFLGYDFTGDDGLPFYAILTDENNTGELKRDIEIEQVHSAEHGTHVSGIATGKDERIGIIPFRVLPQSANRKTGLIYDNINDDPNIERKNALISAELLARSIRDSIYLAKRQGARVANISLGESPSSNISQSEIKTIFNKLRKYISSAAPDMIITAAAGNDSSDVSSGSKIMPCQLRTGNVLCIGSVNKNGELSEFTNNGLQFVDLYAPGEDIISAYPLDHAKFNGTRPYTTMSGTSQAAPYVANAIAKILIYNSCLSTNQIISILKNTATKKQAQVKLGNSNKVLYKYLVIDRVEALKVAQNTKCAL